MKLNVKLLDATLAHIEEEAKKEDGRWDQGYYRTLYGPDKRATRCNTSMCFAGWAVTLAGCRWATSEYSSDLLAARKSEIDKPGTYLYGGLWVIGADVRARRELGLTRDQADSLFDSANTLSDLQTLVKKFKQGVKE